MNNIKMECFRFGGLIRPSNQHVDIDRILCKEINCGCSTNKKLFIQSGFNLSNINWVHYVGVGGANNSMIIFFGKMYWSQLKESMLNLILSKNLLSVEMGEHFESSYHNILRYDIILNNEKVVNNEKL